MLSKILSAAVIGLDGEIIEVEADLVHSYTPGIFIVGLPDKAVEESRERIRSAIKNSGLAVPRKRIVINLAPADLKKQGPAYDLPIAVSILIAQGEINFDFDYNECLFVGELALEGSLRSVNGVLSIVLTAQNRGIKKIFLPRINAPEASLVPGLEIIPLDNLEDLIMHLNGEKIIEPIIGRQINLESDYQNYSYDMAFVKGQEQAKRVLEIAAAGAHNILMTGPPGSGKTLLARTMPSILPQLTLEEAIEITKIYSIAGLLPTEKPLVTNRPFRNPHHTASAVSLVGGGSWPKPGEVSLSHRGVLFLDEFCEFPRAVLENLRQPLEDGFVTISRASGTSRFPARFILVAAMNPCPCGYSTDPSHECTCTPLQIINYQKKISGPLLDRIDLHVEVPRMKFEKLSTDNLAESSKDIRLRVNQARQRQLERFKTLNIFFNSEMNSQQIKEFCPIDSECQKLIKQAVEKMQLSARAYFRILKISRTIADLAGGEQVQVNHLAEALQYRPKTE